jgi:hypothetical protein
MSEGDWLQVQLLDFARTVRSCLVETTYAEDRAVFQRDLSMIAGWLVDIHEGRPQKEVINEILGVESGKYFHDYWRRGVWGDRENHAFEALRASLKQRTQGLD